MPYSNELVTILNNSYENSVKIKMPIHTSEMDFLYLMDDVYVQKAIILTSLQQNSNPEHVNEVIHKTLKSFLNDNNFFPKTSNRGSIPKANYFDNFERFLETRFATSSKSEITPIDFTMGLINFLAQENEGNLLSILTQIKFNVRFFTQNLVRVSQNPNIEIGIDGNSSEAVTPGGEENGSQKLLESFCIDLIAEADKGVFGAIIGRHQELQTVITTLARKKKNNPILLGDAGVGKTAIAEALALRIYNKEVPEVLENATLYSLDIGAMMADTKFRGDVEARMKMLIDKLMKDHNDGKKPILFIDEIHMIIGAGGVGTSMDVGNLLKPILTKGYIRFFGATTETEYRNIVERDKAIERRFNKVEVKEPSHEDAVMILEGIKSQYEEHHKVTYTPEALSSAVKLSAKFIQDRKLPDKAIDLIDYSGALQHIAPPELRKSIIDVTEIETALASMVKVPVKKVSDEEKQKLSELSAELHSSIYGQDEAVELVSDTIIVSSAKLGNPNKPIGSFLFVGPTGVGKTELVKQLAEKMHMPMFRFDMSEYKEPHKISLLLGSPPGYVGSDKGGDLTEKVHKNPHCVVLLDEIEKAHSSIFDTFLQVMDNGRLTDSQGREIDFRHVVFIMTSNAGSSQIAANKPGFVSGASTVNADIMQGVKDTFRPEFINRLDAVVPFKQLGREHISKVAKKFLMALSTDLLEHHSLEMDFDETVIEWFGNEGYDIVMGARPMERAIKNNLTKPLSKQLLSFNKEDKAALEKVVIRIKDNAVDIQLV